MDGTLRRPPHLPSPGRLDWVLVDASVAEIRHAFTLDTRSLALYRIGLGLLLVTDCLLRSRDMRLMPTLPVLGTHCAGVIAARGTYQLT